MLFDTNVQGVIRLNSFLYDGRDKVFWFAVGK